MNRSKDSPLVCFSFWYSAQIHAIWAGFALRLPLPAIMMMQEVEYARPRREKREKKDLALLGFPPTRFCAVSSFSLQASFNTTRHLYLRNTFDKNAIYYMHLVCALLPSTI